MARPRGCPFTHFCLRTQRRRNYELGARTYRTHRGEPREGATRLPSRSKKEGNHFRQELTKDTPHEGSKDRRNPTRDTCNNNWCNKPNRRKCENETFLRRMRRRGTYNRPSRRYQGTRRGPLSYGRRDGLRTPRPRDARRNRSTNAFTSTGTRHYRGGRGAKRRSGPSKRFHTVLL